MLAPDSFSSASLQMGEAASAGIPLKKINKRKKSVFVDSVIVIGYVLDIQNHNWLIHRNIYGYYCSYILAFCHIVAGVRIIRSIFTVYNPVEATISPFKK